MTNQDSLRLKKLTDSTKSSASFERPDDTTAYTAGDVVGTATANLTFLNVLATEGAVFKILGATLEIDISAVPSGMDKFTLHLYDAVPTVIADNTAYDLPAGDRAKYLGYISLAKPVDIGATLWSQNDEINFVGKLTATTLYGILATDGAYTPSAEDVFKVTIYTKAA